MSVARKVNLAALAAADVPDSSPPPMRQSGVTELPIDKVTANPLNQRSDTEEHPQELEQLAATIREHGVLQPLVVATTNAFLERFPEQQVALGGARWVALIGNRRLSAARSAGLAQIPALVNDARAASMFEVMLVENSHRRDLAPLREAEAMRRVLEREDVSQRELARRIGRTPAYVSQRLALLMLVPPLREALEDGSLPVKLAREFGTRAEEDQLAVAAAGPPDWTPTKSVNRVKVPARQPQRRTIPAGNPAAAATSIREVYSGDELMELVRLLSE